MKKELSPLSVLRLPTRNRTKAEGHDAMGVRGLALHFVGLSAIVARLLLGNLERSLRHIAVREIKQKKREIKKTKYSSETHFLGVRGDE